MQKVTTSVLMFFGLVWLSNVAHAVTRLASGAPIALVYRGPGVCLENCSEAAAAVAHRAGFRVKYVRPEDISEALLARGSVWIQPGGDAIVVAKQITREQKLLLRQFVAKGGAYLGF